MFKIETPKNIWIEKVICLRRKAYSFEIESDNIKKLKSISKSRSKKYKFQKKYNCLIGVEQEKKVIIQS